MRQRFLLGVLVSAISAGQAWAADPSPIFVDQGPSWTPVTRADFYSRDQGARMIPLAWLQALKQPDGQPFLAGSLARYGYLPNPANSNGLPVGFTASGPEGAQTAGMTCSACHTRQIIAEGKTYRIDGGPAIVDFQSFLTDLDTAVGQVLTSDAAFQPFAVAVLGSATADPEDISALRQRVDAWYLRYHTLMTRALPKDAPWGPARLDAVGMIFNRLTGLDLGPPPSLLIPDNIRRADAPTRYPFLWNAPVQDKIQWPGFADNGNDVLALARNLGQVIGVFGVFEPRREGLFVNFLNNNSANFDGLGRIEGLLKQLGPPRWPWLVDTNLAAQGKAIYDRPTAQGGCDGPRDPAGEGPVPQRADLGDTCPGCRDRHPGVRRPGMDRQDRRAAGRLHPVRDPALAGDRSRLQHSRDIRGRLDRAARPERRRRRAGRDGPGRAGPGGRGRACVRTGRPAEPRAPAAVAEGPAGRLQRPGPAAGGPEDGRR